MKAMRSRRWVMVFRFSAIAVFIAASSALVTYYACNMSRPDWESVFRDKREELEKFASDVASGELKPSDDDRFQIPPNLSRARFLSIKRKGGFLLFMLRTDWPDDQFEIIAYDLENRPKCFQALYSLFSASISLPYRPYCRLLVLLHVQLIVTNVGL
jgi:hypothetical protein